MTDKNPKKRRKPGPEPERLRLDVEDWREVARRVVNTKPPEGEPPEGQKKPKPA